MTAERNCKTCKYYKDGYCENLELKPCYPQKGCEYFSKCEELKKEMVSYWIPVSERLPEVMGESNGEYSDDVLICVEDDEHIITISTGFYGYYPKSISQQGWWSMWAYGCHQLDGKYKVIAWMPLPELYKTESEE